MTFVCAEPFAASGLTPLTKTALRVTDNIALNKDSNMLSPSRRRQQERRARGAGRYPEESSITFDTLSKDDDEWDAFKSFSTPSKNRFR
jgi:hypothetical protein